MYKPPIISETVFIGCSLRPDTIKLVQDGGETKRVWADSTGKSVPLPSQTRTQTNPCQERKRERNHSLPGLVVLLRDPIDPPNSVPSWIDLVKLFSLNIFLTHKTESRFYLRVRDTENKKKKEKETTYFNMPVSENGEVGTFVLCFTLHAGPY